MSGSDSPTNSAKPAPSLRPTPIRLLPGYANCSLNYTLEKLGLMPVTAVERVAFRRCPYHYRLDDIEAAYELFAHQRDGVMKVAITP